MAHTKGPWAVEMTADSYLIGQRRADSVGAHVVLERIVARVWNESASDEGRERAQANATLIAAAPEQQAKIDALYEALKRVLAIATPENTLTHASEFSAARAALSRAEETG